MILRRKRKIAALLICFAIATLIWTERVRVGAFWWHLWHTTVTVGNFIVPVPKNWYEQKQNEDAYLLVRLDTNDRRATTRLKTHAGVLVSVAMHPFSEADVQRMAALQTSLLQKQGLGNVMTRTLSLDRHTLVCVGGDVLSSGGIVETEPESWRCRAPGGLEVSVTATRGDMDQVWGILSAIRRADPSSESPMKSTDHQ